MTCAIPSSASHWNAQLNLALMPVARKVWQFGVSPRPAAAQRRLTMRNAGRRKPWRNTKKRSSSCSIEQAQSCCAEDAMRSTGCRAEGISSRQARPAIGADRAMLWKCSNEYSDPIRIRAETTLSLQPAPTLNLGRSCAGAYPTGSLGRRLKSGFLRWAAIAGHKRKQIEIPSMFGVFTTWLKPLSFARFGGRSTSAAGFACFLNCPAGSQRPRLCRSGIAVSVLSN
jgi:hypothetical protein